MTVDPAADSAAPENPQTWNRYAYALNNPMGIVDPDGRCPTDPNPPPPSQTLGQKIASAVTSTLQHVLDSGSIIGSGQTMSGQQATPMQRVDAVVTVVSLSAAVIGTAAALESLPARAVGATASEGAAARGATAAETAAETPASTPVGRSGSHLGINPGTNADTVIGGRLYRGHALDSMQERGLTPAVVEDTIQTGAGAPGNTSSTTTHHSSNVTVVTDTQSGRVVTTRKGKP